MKAWSDLDSKEIVRNLFYLEVTFFDKVDIESLISESNAAGKNYSGLLRIILEHVLNPEFFWNCQKLGY